jgi:hypothetical protein
VLRAARELNESKAFDLVMDTLMDEIKDQFMSTPVEQLESLQLEGKAIDRLRGKVKSALIDILETVNG